MEKKFRINFVEGFAVPHSALFVRCWPCFAPAAVMAVAGTFRETLSAYYYNVDLMKQNGELL